MTRKADNTIIHDGEFEANDKPENDAIIFGYSPEKHHLYQLNQEGTLLGSLE